MDYIKDLHEMCETLSEAIREANEKIRAGGGKLTAGDVDYADKLTHALKSVKATIAMMEDEDDGNSNHYPYYMGGNYNDGRGSYRMNRGSYARGRRNAPRDSMGRYSGERGYSRNDLADKMRELMDDAPDERTRQEIQRMVDKLENA